MEWIGICHVIEGIRPRNGLEFGHVIEGIWPWNGMEYGHVMERSWPRKGRNLAMEVVIWTNQVYVNNRVTGVIWPWNGRNSAM